jgi:hypothetical protein
VPPAGTCSPWAVEAADLMRILIWHVHGSWTTSFVQGPHDYLLPVTADRDGDGLGRARTWNWPASVVEVAAPALARAELDLVVLQRPHELRLVEQWTGRRAGYDVPAVYVEHNTPGGDVPRTRHPLAEQDRIPVIHVTHFNRLMWDCGTAPTTVIEHGVVDPGYRYSGETPRAAVAVNEPVRRGRAVGTDLLAGLAAEAPLDVFGMGLDDLRRHLGRIGGGDDRVRTFEDLPQSQLHGELARRRVYVHTARWTSLGLSLLEAMHLGLPVVALATTEAARAVPPDAGVVTADPSALAAATRRFLDDPDVARATGLRARQSARRRYGLERFLTDWDAVLGRRLQLTAR